MTERRSQVRTLLFRAVSGLVAAGLSVAVPVGAGSPPTPAAGEGRRIVLHESGDVEPVLDGVVVVLPEVVVPGFRAPRAPALRVWFDADTTLGFDRDRREVGIRVALDVFRLARRGR